MSDENNCGGSVWLVEDNESIQKLMTRIFARGGYDVTTFSSPLEALESPGSGVPLPDLLVVDIGLPGMSGYEFADRFTERHPDPKILFVSGELEEDLVSAAAADGRAFIQKPFKPDELLESARTCLLPA